MAWYKYGRTPADWAFAVNVDGITPNLVPGAVLTAWNAKTGGTQLDMSVDGGATTVSSIVASDGTDGLIPGTVDEHWVQQATYWIDGSAGAGPRTLMVTSDGPDIAVAAKLEADNQQDQIDNNSALLALVPVMCVAVLGVYPTRPALAGSRVVIWVGGSPPGTGAGGAVEGDIWWDTVP
jgi:hypothetical protein